MSPSRSAYLLVALHRLLPARLLGRLVHWLTRIRTPILKNALIRTFVRLYAVDTRDAAAPVPHGYPSFNAFFTRELTPGARPVDPDDQAIVCPADGTIQQIGNLSGAEILQVKGLAYGAGELLGSDIDADRYRDGSFATIYLAPWNYHRVHMPLTGRILSMRHVPGELWSVSPRSAAAVPRLFARNERLICHCEGTGYPFAVVLVGALNVGSISTVWAGEVLPSATRTGSEWNYASPGQPGITLERGAQLGWFNMGSTVIVLLPASVARWADGLRAGGAVRVGMTLGRLRHDTGSRRA
jgi:phosphatidylserine decarboxylase